MTANLCLLHFFALIVILIILIDFAKLKSGNIANIVFSTLLVISIIVLVIDVLADVFYGKPGVLNYVLHKGFRTIFYILIILPAMIYVFYADYHVFSDVEQSKKLLRALLSIFILNAALTIINLFTNLYFYIDKENIYHRGPLFPLHILISCMLYLYAATVLILNRKSIDQGSYRTLLLFPIFPVAGLLVQMFNVRFLVYVPSLVLSVVINYFHILDLRLNTDYLTGVYNRRSLDKFLNTKIKHAKKYKSNFAIILIDMDEFKTINDTFGHQMGDDALKETVNLLKSCVHSSDVIVRYGGDEFCIILDVDSEEELKTVAMDIDRSWEIFNRTTEKPYRLNLSMGYEMFRPDINIDAEQLIDRIDRLMYIEKAKNKAKKYANLNFEI